ncbi:DUF4328 domain-containing protein [Hymenobacter sp. BT186]|uniref:DUF4328 domain-containing protein n=1 Tax=Hymenobacter telluris TaxID=2816474 RepID=A0A939ETE6_9BACT|nr:DUF4328 domain-containing protein [Hymenobacter telluris]MBO0356616.1 DUF4328 domain-containing protein [Hymenobacter telluris]MBW3372641.1 DUF4328 domain-containing protein [Hymenobacter norwichensis]
MLRNNADRARQAIVTFYSIAGVSLGTAVLDLLYINRLSHAGSEASTLDSLLDISQGLVSLVQLALIVAGFVVLIRWLRRAYVNLQLAGQSTDYSDGWAAGAWFVPFLNLFRPYSIVREVWRGTQLQAFNRVQPHKLLRVWWVVHILDSFLGNAAGRVAFRAETLPELENSTWLSFFSNLLGIVAAILTALVVQRIAHFEEQMQLQTQVQELGKPQPEATEFLPTDLAGEQYF